MKISETAQCVLIIVLTALLAGIELFGSHKTGSLGLFGEALHILGDGLPFVGTLVLVRQWVYEEMEGVVENSIRWLNRIFLLCGGVYLVFMGVIHLFEPREIGREMVYFALVGLVGNSAQAYFAHQLQHAYADHRTHRSMMLHLLFDIGASVAVLVAAAVVWVTGRSEADTILSLLLGLVTIYSIPYIEAGHKHDHTCVHGHHHH